VSRAHAHTFHYPKITNRQLIDIYGKEREEFVLFRYFHVAMNFEPAQGGQFNYTETCWSCFNVNLILLLKRFSCASVGNKTLIISGCMVWL